MATRVEEIRIVKGGSFLVEDRRPDEVFTPEDITEEQRMFARVAEDFLRKEVIPREAEIYSKDWKVTRDLLRKAGELDLLRIDIPEKYGGLGLDKVSSAIVGEQFALQASFAGSHSAHVNIGTLPIVFFGTEEQKRKYLPRLATGELIGAYALTEPGSGSDALAAKTRAVLSEDGRYYILNGQKMWITNGGFADIFTVFAKVDGEKFTAFIVERGPGIISGHEEGKMGLDGSSTTALMLEDCRVPVENVLGEVGKGHKIAFNVLNLGRLKLGARSIGAAKLSLNNAVQYAKERHQFGQPICNFGLIQQKLAEMTVRTYVGESMIYRTVGMIDQALEIVDKDDPAQVLKAVEQYAVECSIIKVWVTEALAYVVDEAVQIYGGYGYSKDYPAERAYRDARISRIYEGTNEINRLIIPSQLLKRASGGELALLLAAEGAFDEIGQQSSPDRSQIVGPLPEERGLVAGAKRLALTLLSGATREYADKLRNEQEVLGYIADIVMEIYALESALLRTEKLIASRGEDRCQLQRDITRVFAGDAADRIEHAAKQVITAIAGSDQLQAMRDRLKQLIDHAWTDSIQLRRRIAQSIIKAGRYSL